MTRVDRLHASLSRLGPGEWRDIYILRHPQAWTYGFAGLNRNFAPSDRHLYVGRYNRSVGLHELDDDVTAALEEQAQG